MRRKILFSSLILLGFCLILIGLSVHQIQAQDDERDYVGVRECASCHRDVARPIAEGPHALALIENDDGEFFIADFEAGAEVRTVALAPSADPRPFGVEDIAYALGKGRYVQRYVVEYEDTLIVLPAEWNNLTSAWQAYGPVENWPNDPVYDFTANCVGCHVTGYDPERNRWQDEGVQCEACHGPGSIHLEEADDAGGRPNEEELLRIRSNIVLSPDPQICGQCHSTGLAADGVHPFAQGFIPGNELLAADSFTLVDGNDPAHWWPTGQAASTNMQFNEWFTSAHANALETLKSSAGADDSCLQCHSGDYRHTQIMLASFEAEEKEGDPPTPITLENAQLGITCTTCHNVHADVSEVEFFLRGEPYALCVECHSDRDASDGLHHPVQQMYEGQTVIAEVEAIPSSHFTNENGPQCTTCHLARVPVESFTLASHSLQPVLPGSALDVEGLTDTCSACHAEEVEAQGLQSFIDDIQDNTSTRLVTAQNALGEDSPEWVSLALEFIEGDGSQGIHNYAYTNAILLTVETELGLIAPDDTANQPGAVDGLSGETPAPVVVSTTQTVEEDEGIPPIALAIMALASLILLGGAWLIFRTPEANDASH